MLDNMAPSLSRGILAKVKAHPTTVSFASVNQKFGGSSQLSTTADRTIIIYYCLAHFRQQNSA